MDGVGEESEGCGGESKVVFEGIGAEEGEMGDEW